VTEIYLSTDVESDGPIPGPNSMLSFASAAYLRDKTLVDTFSANLELLPGAAPDPATSAWWSRPENAAAYAKTRESVEAPDRAMGRYVAWVDEISKRTKARPVFVAYPAGFDFLFVYWYLMKYAGKSPFSHSCLDIKTLAMSILKCEYRDAVKKNMPRRWFDPLPHTHVALDDAIEQGALFCNMLNESRP
jgi:hypothetical protein